MTSDVGAQPDCAYSEVQVEGWDRLERKGDALVGECPRCGHSVSKSLKDGPIATAVPEKVTVICNCHQEHKGMTDKAEGCGAYGGKMVTL
jgi:hypothetical protein